MGRSTPYNPVQIRNLIQQGMQTKGFALIEILDTCPTHYGRLNKFGDAGHMLEKVHKMTVPVERAEKMTAEELEGLFLTGVLVNKPREDYYTRYQKIIDRLCTEENA